MKKQLKHKIIIALNIFLYSFSYGQTAEELFENRNYKELVKLEKKAEKLEPRELYLVGFAYFQLGKDNEAITFYDKAIAKGLDSPYIHFYKGLSMNYLKKYKDAIKELDISIAGEPNNQEYLNEKGISYYRLDQLDEALEIFEKAKKLPNTFQAPFYYVPHIHHLKKDYDKALKGFYEALNNISKKSDYYLSTLLDIGKLEFTVTKNHLSSAKAYSEAISLDPENYEIHSKLMKSYNAAKEYKKADSVFNIVKTVFEKGNLPKEDMEIKTIAIGEFEWEGQKAVIRKLFVDPKEVLDISYKVFLLNKEGDKVERRFVIEKCTPLKTDDTKHLLCEQDKKTGGHITYPYGWSVDNIPLDELEDAIKLILDKKMKQAASSNFGR